MTRYFVQAQGCGYLSTPAGDLARSDVRAAAIRQADRAASAQRSYRAWLAVRIWDRGLLGETLSTYRWDGQRWAHHAGTVITGLEGREAPTGRGW